MKNLINFIIAILISININAQDEMVKLIGESADGKSVKMIWFFKTWDKSTVGFDIKRRIIEIDKPGEWEKLNSTPITPSISVTKSLSNTGIGEEEAQRLQLKLQNLIQKNQVKEISPEDYLKRLQTDNKALEGLAFAIALDYDFALINGFAFIDITPLDGKKYEYGLFLVEKSKTANKPSSIFSWLSGTKAMLNPDIVVKGKTFVRQGKVQLSWNVNTEKIKDIYVAGFNIYKKEGTAWIKINTDPVNTKSLNGKGYYWLDTTASSTASTTYGVAMQTIFKNEGDKSIYKYIPAENPPSFKSPVLEEVSSAGENFADGFAVKWLFSKDDEMFIKSFVIEKANLPDGFKNVYEIIPRSRNMTDVTFSPPASYVSFRVVAIYLDGTRLNSNEKILYYLPVIKAPKPQNLNVTWVMENKKLYADLSWNPKNAKDTLTDYYLIYASNPVNGKFMQAGGLPLYSNSYRFEIMFDPASRYKFGVTAVSKYKFESEMSDTAIVMSPSKKLPYIQINTIIQDSNRVQFTWTYPEIWDLKGFRVFQNGNMVASEFELNKDIRKFKTPGLKWNADYNFSVQAVSENGVVSEMSIPAGIRILITQKK